MHHDHLACLDDKVNSLERRVDELFYLIGHGGTNSNREILSLLKSILLQGEKIMALSQESKDLLKKLDTATSAIGARIQALLDKPNTTEAEFRTALAPLATALDEMGKDPNNPIPPVP